MMTRRTALAAAVVFALLAMPLAARAQPADKPSRVGVLSGGSAVAKPLQLLAELVPGLFRVAVLLNPDTPPRREGRGGRREG